MYLCFIFFFQGNQKRPQRLIASNLEVVTGRCWWKWWSWTTSRNQGSFGCFGGRKNGFGFVELGSEAEGKLRKDWIRFQGCCAAHQKTNVSVACCLLDGSLDYILTAGSPWRVDEELAYTWHGICVTLFAVQAWWRSNDLGGVSSDQTLSNSCGPSKQRWPRAGTSPL